MHASEGAPRVPVDTNVWISAFINPNGAPARVFDALRQERFVLVLSSALLDEIRDVVHRPRVRRRVSLSDADLNSVLDRLIQVAVYTFPTGVLRLCRDPKDDVVLETAILGQARYVVSRDDIKRDLDLVAHLRAYGIEVLSVAQFLDLLAAPSP